MWALSIPASFDVERAVSASCDGGVKECAPCKLLTAWYPGLPVQAKMIRLLMHKGEKGMLVMTPRTTSEMFTGR